jgi:uncharacterized OB-fold protein
MSPFREGLQQGELRYQACSACQAPQTLARYACRRCGSTQLEWRKAAGRGVVYAATLVARAPYEEFRPLAPYTLALVDLDEGVRLMGHAAPGLAIGDPVGVEFFQFAGRTLIRFVKVGHA